MVEVVELLASIFHAATQAAAAAAAQSINTRVLSLYLSLGDQKVANRKPVVFFETVMNRWLFEFGCVEKLQFKRRAKIVEGFSIDDFFLFFFLFPSFIIQLTMYE